MKTYRLLSSIAVLSVLLAVVPDVLAHRPIWDEGNVLELENLDTSFAFYRDLTVLAPVDVYIFEATAGDHLHAGINIPVVSGLEAYNVSMALLGPGLPHLEHDLLPPEHPEDLGGIVIPGTSGADFFEPFTQTSYWGRQRAEIDLPETGTYYLLVWNLQGAPGKYVLDTGTAEVFSPADMFLFPIWWVGVHAFFGHTPTMLAALLLALSLMAVYTLRHFPKLIQTYLAHGGN